MSRITNFAPSGKMSKSHSPSLSALSVNRRSAATSGWEHRAEFEVELRIGRIGHSVAEVEEVPLTDDIQTMLRVRDPAPSSKQGDFLMKLAVKNPHTEDRVEIAAFFAKQVQDVLDDLNRQYKNPFEGPIASDFNHSCKPWDSSYTYVWYTTTQSQRNDVSAASASLAMQEILKPVKKNDLYEIKTSTGADYYKMQNPNGYNFTFVRQIMAP